MRYVILFLLIILLVFIFVLSKIIMNHYIKKASYNKKSKVILEVDKSNNDLDTIADLAQIFNDPNLNYELTVKSD